MATVTLKRAAELCGYRTRSQLQNLKKAGRLNAYLRPGGRAGSDLLELEPPGLPPLVEWVHQVKDARHAKVPVVAPGAVAAGDGGLDREKLRDMVAQLPEGELMDQVMSRQRRDHFEAIRSEWVAELARLDAMERNGELVKAADVRREMFQMCRAMRDNVLGVADRLAGQLAATADIREVRRLLDEELRTALRVLADG